MYSLRRAVSVRYSLTIFGALFIIASYLNHAALDTSVGE